DRFVPRLFDLVVDLPGGLARRHPGRVQLVVMEAELERHGIGMAAYFRDLVVRQRAGRRLEARLIAADARWIGREFDLEIALVRDRAHAGGGHAPEFLDRIFLIAHGL